jgi:hypothetical protein
MRIAIPFVLLIPLALVPLSAAHAACTPFALQSVSPGSGAGGAPVTLTGTGFCGAAENYFAWGWDGLRGFALELDGATPDTTLTGSVVPTPLAVTAPVRLWRVQEVAFADTALQLPNGVYWVRDARLYLFRKEVTGPAFSALPSIGAGHTSQMVGGNLVIDFGSGSSSLRALPQKELAGSPAPGDGSHITVWIVAETDDEEPKGQEPDPQTDPGSIRWALTYEVVCFGGSPACDDPSVTVVGSTLQPLLSPLGMQVNVNGSVLTVGHTGYDLASGMLSVIPEF